MGLSAQFIRRPVGTMLLALGLFLTGMVAFFQLPVASLPSINLPTIMISARLPGADPETMAATVAAPIERRVGRIAGLEELTSTSSEGSTTIVAQFGLSRNVDGAAHDVQAAINASLGDLPVDLPSPPTYRKINPADAPIMIFAVTSKTLAPAQVYDAADRILSQRISQIEGVAQVFVGGVGKPAVRVRVDPTRLAAMGTGLETVRTAIAQSNVDGPTGFLDGPKQRMAIAVNNQLPLEASAYRPLVVKARNGDIVRISQLGSVINGSEDDRQKGWYDSEPAVLVIVTKQAAANVVATADRITAALPQLRRWMPAGTTVSILADRTNSIRGDLDHVEETLLITIGLVILVVYLSLGRMTPTLAASVTVPLSLAATFAVMWVIGYSLDNITLMALIVSVGFVVDDAIVMIENIARHVERGEEPLTAAVAGAGQITFTVISISLSLVAVFIPLLFMGGVIGRLLQVFAVTLSVAILSSALISLTVTPAIYAWLMMHRRHRPPSRVARAGEAAMAHARDLYLAGLKWVMRHQRLMLGVMGATVVATIALYVVIPKGLFPPQDTGMMIVITEARSDIPFKRMAALQQRVAAIILKDPAVADLASFVGLGGGLSTANEGRMFVNLKPLSERVSVQKVINRLRPKLAHIPGVATYMIAGQDLRIGGRLGKGLYQFALWDESLKELREWTPRLMARLKKTPGLEDVASDQDKVAPQVTVTVDRARAAQLGVSMNDIDQVLEDAFAQRQVSTIYTSDNQYHVVLEVSPDYQKSAKSLAALYVPAADGTQVPLSALARFVPATSPLSVTHQGQFPSATISFNLAPGTSLSTAVARIRADADAMHMPETVHANFAGNAKAFAQSVKSEPILILAALLTIYIVLGVLYESTRHPLTILSTLPSAGLGALLALILTGTDLTVISIIGVILLMGIVKKNGIILVDFAIDAERNHGLSPEEAILEACRQRFRPITMTTLTALLGAMPLALALGTGGALRRPLGIAVVGGLLVSQLLTLYTTPVVYLALDRLGMRRRRAAKAETIAP